MTEAWARELPVEVCAPGHPAKVAKETLRDPQLPGVILDIHKGIHNDCQEKVQQSEEDNQPQTQHTSKHIKNTQKRNKKKQEHSSAERYCKQHFSCKWLLQSSAYHYDSLCISTCYAVNMFESQQHEWDGVEPIHHKSCSWEHLHTIRVYELSEEHSNLCGTCFPKGAK